jgi:hypothetical protein
VARAGSLSSSSSSRRAAAQHSVPKKRNLRGTTDQAHVGNSVAPKHIRDIVCEGVGDDEFDDSDIMLEEEEMEMLISK